MTNPVDRLVQFAPMQVGDVPMVAELEKVAYAHPWTPGNLLDAVHHLNHAQLLVCDAGPRDVSPWRNTTGHLIMGYFVAMKGVDEVHLLNLTVAPAFRRQGWATLLLSALATWSRGQQAASLWLEVRQSNVGALALYERVGFKQVGVRKRYYPLKANAREDAVVMQLPLIP